MGATPLMLVPVTTIVSWTTSGSVPREAGSAGSVVWAIAPMLASDVAEMRAACEARQEPCLLIFIVSPPALESSAQGGKRQ